MSLEHAIHLRWGADETLETLLPAERLSTGVPRGATTMPYVVLARRESQTLVRTSSGTCLQRALMRFSVWAGELDQAKQIGLAVVACFDRADFPLDGGYVLNMQNVAGAETQADDGSWRADIDFAVTMR